MKLWNRLRNMKMINICHLLCLNCKKQGKILSLRVFTALANQKEVVLLIPVFSPLCMSVNICSVMLGYHSQSLFYYISLLQAIKKCRATMGHLTGATCTVNSFFTFSRAVHSRTYLWPFSSGQYL